MTKQLVSSADWIDYPYAENRRALQLMPAEPGWQIVGLLHPLPEQDPKAMTVEDLTYLEPVIAWALLEEIDLGRIYHCVRPVALTDFPSYPDVVDTDQELGLLGPSQQLDKHWRQLALDQLERERERRKRAAAKA